MARAEDFDAFYHATRKSLLHQTYALTAGIERSACAVELAYVHAWGHWSKVGQLEDPVSWVRTEAWRAAQSQLPLRGRLKHRISGFGDDVSQSARAVELEALHNLPAGERRAVILHHLGQLPIDRIAREIGIAQSTASSLLARGEQSWPRHQAPLTEALSNIADDLIGVTLMRACSIRRAGARRRRRQTLAGVAASTALLMGAGWLVSYDDPGGVQIASSSAGAEAAGPEQSEQSEQSEPEVSAGALLRDSELRLVTKSRRPWRTTGSAEATDDDELYALCQLEPRADPQAEQALIREFALKKRPAAAVHVIEESAHALASKAAFQRMANWFGRCETDGVQLMRSFRITGLGDQANAFVLREAGKKDTYVTATIARIGRVTTAVVASREGGGAVNPERIVRSTTASIRRLCGAADGTCAIDPTLHEQPPPPQRQDPGFLDAIDLPPVSNVRAAWIGTDPTRAGTRTAGTACERAKFAKAQRARTRVFLVPKATKLPRRFGLDETVAVFSTTKQARRFVATIKERASHCPDRQAAAKVRLAKDFKHGRYRGGLWRFDFELADDSTVFYRVGIVRDHKKVALVTLSPTDRFDMSLRDFNALLLRAGQRLSHMR